MPGWAPGIHFLLFHAHKDCISNAPSPSLMSESLIESFQPLCSEVQKEVQKVLKSILLGPMISGYLPQKWIFATSQEVVTFCLEITGEAHVVEGTVKDPDVLIKISHDPLMEILKTMEKPEKKPDILEISFHTKKGEAAFGYMRKRFGL